MECRWIIAWYIGSHRHELVVLQEGGPIELSTLILGGSSTRISTATLGHEGLGTFGRVEFCTAVEKCMTIPTAITARLLDPTSDDRRVQYRMGGRCHLRRPR